MLKFLIDNWYLVAAAVVSGGLLAWPVLVKGSRGAAISTQEAVRLINREKAVLIDVRDAAEFSAGHASGSRNVSPAQFETSKDLPTNKTLPLVLLCENGARAAKAVAALQKRGHTSVQPVAGGLAAWREAQLPVSKSESAAKAA